MAIMMARNCSPTRHRINFWLRLGLEPRIMFQNPASKTRNTPTAASVVAYLRTLCMTSIRFDFAPVLPPAGGDRQAIKPALSAFGNSALATGPPTNPCHNWHATIGVNFCRELRHISRAKADSLPWSLQHAREGGWAARAAARLDLEDGWASRVDRRRRRWVGRRGWVGHRGWLSPVNALAARADWASRAVWASR